MKKVISGISPPMNLKYLILSGFGALILGTSACLAQAPAAVGSWNFTEWTYTGGQYLDDGSYLDIQSNTIYSSGPAAVGISYRAQVLDISTTSPDYRNSWIPAGAAGNQAEFTFSHGAYLTSARLLESFEFTTAVDFGAPFDQGFGYGSDTGINWFQSSTSPDLYSIGSTITWQLYGGGTFFSFGASGSNDQYDGWLLDINVDGDIAVLTRVDDGSLFDGLSFPDIRISGELTGFSVETFRAEDPTQWYGNTVGHTSSYFIDGVNATAEPVSVPEPGGVLLIVIAGLLGIARRRHSLR